MPSSPTVPTELDIDGQRSLSCLRGDVLNHHSSWAALCICLREKPGNLGALLTIVGVTHQVKAFDACVDAYSVYEDGCTRGRLIR